MEDYKIILRYFPTLCETQIAKYQQLYKIYTAYNTKINLISRKDIHNLYTHHVLHAMSIGRILSFLPNTRILDFGTGGGFPGIPLAILFPKVHFHLVDATQKKIKIVADIAQELQLNNCTITWVRGENIQNTYDFILGRGVTALDQFYRWSYNKIKKKSLHNIKNGVLYLKGGDFIHEIQKINAKTKIYPLDTFFAENFFISKKLVHIF